MTGWNGWIGEGMFGMLHLIWWALGIAGAAMLARWLLGSRRQQDEGEDRVLAVLRERWACV